MAIEDLYEGISHPRNSTLMRVFLNLGLTEHTGHGVPTIIKKYGKEIFEITDNYVKCKIPFDKKVLELSNKNVGLNVGLNKTEKAVLRLLIEDSYRAADVIACFARQQGISLDATWTFLSFRGLSVDPGWCFRYALHE